MKPGTVGENGKVFWSRYRDRNGIVREYWVSPEKYAQFRERSRVQAKNWAERNRERSRSTSKAWRKKYPEKQREACKKWHDANYVKKGRIKKSPEELARSKRESARRNRAKRKGCSTSKLREDRKIMQYVYEIPGRLKSCSGLSFHVDHVFPLSKGGTNSPSNLQILPARVNLKKSNKLGHQ